MARKKAASRSTKPVARRARASASLAPYEAAYEEVPRVFDSLRVAELARAIKLPPNADLRRLEEDIHAAVRYCLNVHCASRFRSQRGEVRKTLDKISKRLSTTARKVRPLLDSLPWPLFFYGQPSKQATSLADELDTHSQAFGHLAKGLARKDSKPQYLAFNALAQSLAQAFQRAAGHPAGITWHPIEGRYEGQFFEFVKALLPGVQRLAKTATGQPLLAPSTRMALGKFLQRLIERMDTTSHQSW
jgi:hypothetical protein